MATSQKCFKCGHGQIIQGVRVVCSTDGSDKDVRLRIDAHPEAMIFKQAQRSVLRASICGKCGYTEFFVDEPTSLYATYLEAQMGS